ncbi:tyrosyl-DNA phosphodiesterase [Xylaria sp. CBS 124048]|nr:tyrosyl-DNA phosphodiesterase [Xylaria sp. CBS 124048]
MSGQPLKRRRDGRDEDGDHEERAAKVGKAMPSTIAQRISPPAKKERVWVPSPFKLTSIPSLPEELNIGAVNLAHLIGDPAVYEVWSFNYKHDIDYFMGQLSPDKQGQIMVHIVHGFWLPDDPNRLLMMKQAKKFPTVQLHEVIVHQPGRHHSKMVVLFRHNGTAQVIIHTANMVEKEWKHMTNGAWFSPRLSKIGPRPEAKEEKPTPGPVGSPKRFKSDLLNYLGAYNTHREVCSPLVAKLSEYDFSRVRAALIASVPCSDGERPKPGTTLWGWKALEQALKAVRPTPPALKADIVVQTSSVATLGAYSTWLKDTLFKALSAQAPFPGPVTPKRFHIVFPVADEIRRSIDGYASGASIHCKAGLYRHTRQLQYMRPLLRHWASDSGEGPLIYLPEFGDYVPHEAGRKRAAPHIKTYIRYAQDAIDWALLTSANLSKEAWGGAENEAGCVRIASFEIGVLVWPKLLTGTASSVMVPVSKTDMPSMENDPEERHSESSHVVGLRVPYDLPLRKYTTNETPWLAAVDHMEKDWKGLTWTGEP